MNSNNKHTHLGLLTPLPPIDTLKVRSNTLSLTPINLTPNQCVTVSNPSSFRLKLKVPVRISLTPVKSPFSPVKSPFSPVMSPILPADKIRPIKLYDYQEPHVKKIVDMLQTRVAVLEYSTMGLGKTTTTSAAATILKLPLIVFGPDSAHIEWRRIGEEHGVQIMDIKTYGILRGRKGCNLNNPYLTRVEDKFYPTPYLQQLVKSGVMFVFDEMDATKNMFTLTHKAVHTIVKEIMQSGSPSRVINISPLPSATEENIQSLCKIMGIILSDKFHDYDKRKRKYILLGILELIDWCRRTDPIKTLMVMRMYMTDQYYDRCLAKGKLWEMNTDGFTNLDKRTIRTLTVQLYSSVVKQAISICMPAQDTPPIENVYYRIYSINDKNGHKADIVDKTLLAAGVRLLNSAVNNRSKVAPGRIAVDMSNVMRAVRIIGISKLNTIFQIVYQTLKRDPNRKFIIGAWYRCHIEWLENALSQFGAKTVYGKITDRKVRLHNVKLFQEDSDICRVLIINPTVAGRGINLDDKHGNRPRTALFIPDYRFMSAVHATYRIWRADTKSKDKTHIYFVYSPDFRKEANILKNLVKKSGKAKTVISGSNLHLPSNYKMIDVDIVRQPVQTPQLPSMTGLIMI